MIFGRPRRRAKRKRYIRIGPPAVPRKLLFSALESQCADKFNRDPGSDRLDSAPALSRSSGRAHDGPMTRGLLQGVQTSRASNQDTTRGTQGLSTVDSGSLRGLTPAPLPPDILPSKKRTLGEVLRDESPPRKDKLSAEIDQLYGEGTSHSRSSSAGPSNARDAPTPRSHRHKKSKANEDSPNLNERGSSPPKSFGL